MEQHPVIGRLINWKFGQALDSLPADADHMLKSLVEALALCFGNCGWFEGHMGTVVEAAVNEAIALAEKQYGQT